MLERYKVIIFGATIIAIVAGIVALLTVRPAPTVITIIPPGPTATLPPMRVYITGAVANPKTYTLPPGSRLEDAINAAGGTRPDADTNRINLAQFVHDGDKIDIPVVNGSAAAKGSVGTAGPSIPGEGFPIHINTATLEQLELLPGVGPSLGQQIIDYRSAHGSFKSVSDLDNVPGVGPSRLKEWADKIVFD